MKTPLSFIWFAALVAPALGQDSSSTNGPCSPISPNNQGTITIQCSGLSEQLGAHLVEILNRIVQKQLDPQLVMGKLDDIGKGIEDLRNRSTAAERGIISIYDFNGARRTGRPGVMSLEVGPEIATFQRMRELNSQHRWSQLLELSEKQISDTPNWLTPYLFAGIAYANLGQPSQALDRWEYVTKHDGGDPQYQKAHEFIARLRANQGLSQ